MAVAILMGELMIMNLSAMEMMMLAQLLGLEGEPIEPEEPTHPLAELNPIRYRGYYWDAETGYYWLKTRYYNPEWRRFINADSYFIAGEDKINATNMYAYCGGNPVRYYDPTGMDAWANLGVALVISVAAFIGAWNASLQQFPNISLNDLYSTLQFLFSFDAFIDAYLDIAVTLYGEDRGSDYRAGQNAIATIIKNRFYGHTSPGYYSSFHDVVTEPGGFGGLILGWNALRTQEIDFAALVNAFSVAFKLMNGWYINPQGLGPDYFYFVASGVGCSLGDSSSRRSIGDNDFYRARTGRFP